MPSLLLPPLPWHTAALPLPSCTPEKPCSLRFPHTHPLPAPFSLTSLLSQLLLALPAQLTLMARMPSPGPLTSAPSALTRTGSTPNMGREADPGLSLHLPQKTRRSGTETTHQALKGITGLPPNHQESTPTPTRRPTPNARTPPGRRQRRDHVRPRLCLPPGVHDGAALAAHQLVVPVPGQPGFHGVPGFD